jgi:hypothetical protein
MAVTIDDLREGNLARIAAQVLLFSLAELACFGSSGSTPRAQLSLKFVEQAIE